MITVVIYFFVVKVNVIRGLLHLFKFKQLLKYHLFKMLVFCVALYQEMCFICFIMCFI